MKILFVTIDNYPFEGACSNIILNLLFSGNLKEKVGEVSVLATKKNVDDADEESIDSVKIYRVLTWNLIPIRMLKKYLQLKSFCELLYFFFCKLFCFFQKKYLGKGCFDHSISKVFYKMLKKINAEKFDVIITITGLSEISVAVSKFSKRKNCKFVLYQVDPISTNKAYAKSTKNLREKIEYSIYKNASAIITTPIIAQEHGDDFFSCFAKKTYSMEFPAVKPRAFYKKQNSPLRCMFLGSFYGNIRKPDYTIELFRDLLCDGYVTLEFVGNIDDNLKKYLGILPIKCWGCKSISECQEMMQQADVLINVGNAVDNQVPSKIFDYISTGKPIVNVCKIKNCPTLPYLSRYGSSLSLVENGLLLDSQKKQLNDFLHSLPKIVSNQELFENFNRCTPEFVANEMIDCLKNI